MASKSSSKTTVLEHVLMAKVFLGQAMANFEQGGNCLEVIKLLNDSREQLRLADELILNMHLKECLEKIGPDLVTEEIIKSFKYSHA